MTGFTGWQRVAIIVAILAAITIMTVAGH